MGVALSVVGGEICDGVSAVPLAGDLLIGDGRVRDIVQPDTGPAESSLLDATGCIVAPGFVNILSQAALTLQRDGRGLSDLLQGVTTEVFGEGLSPGPFDAASMEYLAKVEPPPDGAHVGSERLRTFLDDLAAAGVAVNVASYVGAHNLRMLGAGADDRPLTSSELDRARGVLTEELQDGALGVASALIYPPGCFAGTEELIAWAEVAARYDACYASHLRSEGALLLRAVDEFLEIVTATGCHGEVFHLKAAGLPRQGLLDHAVARLTTARTAGHDVSANAYPYTMGATWLGATIPPPLHRGGLDRLLAMLESPTGRAAAATAVRTPSEEWESPWHNAGGGRGVVLLSDVGLGVPTRGRALSDVAAELGTDDIDLLIDLVRRNPWTLAAFELVTEESLRTVLSLPWVSIASDGEAFTLDGPFANDGVHPRAFGTFARVLGTYVRDLGLLSLPEAIRRMTSLPADSVGLRDRGRLIRGAAADVVVFDPATINATADYMDPRRYATGVRHVVVNGTIAVRDGEFTGALAGRALRRHTS